MSQNPFEELARLSQESGTSAALEFLERHFREENEYFKLFEVLKMQCRQRLGLALMYSQQPDDLNEKQQRELEDGLLDACRDVGTLLLQSGKLQEGWMYLQPIGDHELTDRLIRAIEPNEDNLDLLVDVAVSQGAAPVYGFGLLLEHYGTCNGITTFDTQAAQMPGPIRKGMAEVLLRHLYRELTGNIRHATQDGEQESGGPEGLAELMQTNPQLTADGAHHIDTTHLASVMRIARLVDDPADLKRAVELAEYGGRLAEEYRYPGNPPFEETYVDHRFFYSALLGENVDAAIGHFEQKIETVDSEQFGPIAEETLVDFLVRLGRNDQAMSVVIKRMREGKHESMGGAPGPMEIANSRELLGTLNEYYREEGDLLGYGMTELQLREIGVDED